MVERGGQLQTAPTDERHRLAHCQLNVNRNHLSGLLQPQLAAEDLTGKDQRLRLRAGLGQPTRYEQLVQAFLASLLFHRDLGSGEWDCGLRIEEDFNRSFATCDSRMQIRNQ